jgi:anti-sigma-K factor RskA
MSGEEHVHEDVGAYLLGALEESERAAFERHLAGCPECRDEVERLRPAAEALPRSVEPLAAPRGLKAAVMQAVADEGDAAPAARLRGRPFALRLPRLSPAVAWGMAAVLLLVGLAGGFGIGKLAQGGSTRVVTAQVKSPALRGASGTLTVPRHGRTAAILHVSGLPNPRGRVYQAWVERGGEVTPQPTFRPGSNGVGEVALPADLHGAKAVLVTREPPGGSRAPSEAPVLEVRL